MSSSEHLESSDLAQLNQRYRAQLINSLSGFKSINLVGTIDPQGIPNLSIVSSVVHLGANPALMGFIMRPITVTRDTYHNILDTKQYTFNHILPEFHAAAHQTSARYPAEVSEFEAVGLHPEFSDRLKAPYVKESAVKVGLAFREKIDIKLNGTVLIIGEIVELFFPKSCLSNDGYLDIEQAGSITVSGLDAYHSTQRLSRLSYAKPDKSLEEII